jgi:hypothetical protein
MNTFGEINLEDSGDKALRRGKKRLVLLALLKRMKLY